MATKTVPIGELKGWLTQAKKFQREIERLLKDCKEKKLKQADLSTRWEALAILVGKAEGCGRRCTD